MSIQVNTLDTLREIERDYQNKIASNIKLRAQATDTEKLRKIENRIKRYTRYLAALKDAIHTESNLTGEQGT